MALPLRVVNHFIKDERWFTSHLIVEPSAEVNMGCAVHAKSHVLYPEVDSNPSVTIKTIFQPSF